MDFMSFFRWSRKKTQITVVINNRNLLSWPKEMVNCIEKFDDLAEIIIIDNDSTYKPLIEWYEQIPHRVIYADNYGHTAPWIENINKQIKIKFYVVTDPDLDLSGLPNDTLQHLRNCLMKFPEAGKIGLGLEIKCVPQNSPYYTHVQTYERKLWDLPLIETWCVKLLWIQHLQFITNKF